MQAQPARPSGRKRVQAQPAGFNLLSSALAASAACGRTSPLLCAAIWRRSFLWEVGTSYNERRLLWGAVRFVQAVSCVRRIPRRRRELRAGSACGAEEGAGSACRAGQPAFMRAYRIRGARRFLWEVIHSIISGGFYGKSVRFVWAVTCMRTAPRPPHWRGAEEHAGSACPPVREEGILKEEGKNPLLAAKEVGGAAGGALYWILITR